MEKDDGVTSYLSDTRSGTTYQVRSKYLVGCDGAGSRVRRSANLKLTGGPLYDSYSPQLSTEILTLTKFKAIGYVSCALQVKRS
jgi:flavin-dependent dehydrogenase